MRNLDSVAPTVTGHAASQPNANGWYNDDVTVQWTVTDADPSSGIVAQPSDPVINGEGGDLSAESGPVCDVAGNCSTGFVSGNKIDRTKPSVDVAGVEDGKTYTLGGGTDGFLREATDHLSGVDGECDGTVTGGTANGVGDFVYAAKATDKAGNVRLVSVAYRVVYRFDGFQQPINDPVLVPGAARSVFKSGSTVPVKFQVKRADGTLVEPGDCAGMVDAGEGGSPTGASVNEAVWSEPATSGTQFEKTGDQWHYNWKTKGVAAGYTYRIGVRLDDGTKHYVVVGEGVGPTFVPRPNHEQGVQGRLI
ncbi:MAG: PxKF domain-containing protein [Candidatus Nanopelagicales bacterium]